MNKWIQLHICKKLINSTVRVLNVLLSGSEGKFPQTKLLEQVYQKLERVYAIEAYCGRFDDMPHQTLKTVRDRHFLNILNLSRKFLIYLADEDRYYRQWLGLFMLLVHDDIEMFQQGLGKTEILEQINSQWNYGLEGESFEEFLQGKKRLATELILCSYLNNLIMLDLNRGEKTK